MGFRCREGPGGQCCGGRVGGQERRQQGDGGRQGQHDQSAALQSSHAHPSGPRPATAGEFKGSKDRS